MLSYKLERGNAALTVAAILALVLAVLLLIYGAFCMGQRDIVMQCETTTFFQVGKYSYECLPYHKGMLQ